MGDAPRDSKGRVGKGNNLRGTATKTKAKFVSTRLRKEFIRRYANAPLDPAKPDGEKFGKERAQLKHLFVLMDIMENTAEKAQDRIRAVEALADRKDGKPVQAIELTGADGGPVETETTVNGDDYLTPAQRLAQALKSLGVLAQHGGVNASGPADGVGGGIAAGDASASGDSGSGDRATE